MCQTAARALCANGFDAVCVPNAEAARAAILSRIPAGATIGFGSSVTLQEIGLLPALEAGGFDLLNPPNKKMPDSKPERDALRRRAVQADVAIASANAITLDGEIVSTDGTGNRVSFYMFGPKHTILVAGANKIVPDVFDAQQRIRRIAAPANANRLDKKTAPCFSTGICDDAACTTIDRICNVTVILHKKPSGIEKFSVILVSESLGF
jgi:L-lactate utilization protein LutB